MPRLAAITALLASLAVAAPAAAQAPVPPSQPPAEQPPPAPQPAPAPPAATMTLSHTGVGPDGAVLAGRRWRVRGRLDPATDGQRVTIRVSGRGRKARTRRVRVRNGRFRATFRVRHAASLTVRATHRATPELGAASAKPLRIDVLPRRVRAGQRGLAVRLLQRRLARQGYVVGRRGTFDARTGRAVLAFRKVTGLRRTSLADRSVMSRLARGGGRYRLRFPRHGKHVEADLSRQVIVLARGSRVERIYPTSSGSPATPTIRGSFRFYMAQPGFNSNEMYFSKYFRGGYAIHGYKSVPPYPASHGCLRVPIPDAVSIFNWIAIGDRIDVYA